MGQTGYLHSIESMGVFDGPGIRTIFFLQGCPLRCAYCHNPDSQAFTKEKTISPQEVLRLARRFRMYYGKDGGITFSGGEPLSQGAFLAESLKLLKEEGFHTCIDTSGVGDPRYYKAVLPYADLLLLDVKQFNELQYREITGAAWTAFWRFAASLEENGFKGKLWIRHVMVPGISDNIEAMEDFVRVIEPLRPFIERIEILPYHVMGVEKYKQLGLPYRLEGIEPMDKSKAKIFEAYVRERFFAQPAGTVLSADERRAIMENIAARRVAEPEPLSREALRQLPLLCELNEEDFSRVLPETESHRLGRGDFVFRSGEAADRFYILYSGRMKIYRNTPEGKEQILYIYNPGDFVGGLNLLTSDRYLYTAQALEDCEILVVRKKAFDLYMKDNPAILREICLKSFDRIRWAEELISRLYADHSDIKTAALLLRLADDFGLRTTEGTVCHLSMDRDEMASYAGLSRERLEAKIKTFAEAGWLEWIDEKTLLLKDTEALKRLPET